MDLKRGFADHCRFEVGLMASTIDQYLARLLLWEEATGKSIEAITSDDVRAWIRQTPLARETVKGRVVALQQFHRWGALDDLWPLNGISLIRVRKVTNDSPPPLPHADARALMAACQDPLEFRLVYYPLLEGTRPMESAAMDHHHWQGGWLRFVGKGNKFREVPIHPLLARVGPILLSHPPCHKSSFYSIRDRLAKRSGVWFRPHQLRKTYATCLFDQDVPDEVLGDLLGHGKKVTRVYALVSRAKKTKAMALLDYRSS